MGIWDRMEQLIGQGLHTSREVLARARDKAQELGEIGQLKYELSQLEKQAQKLSAAWASRCSTSWPCRARATVSREAVKELVAELEELRKKIEQKEGDLQALR